MKDKEPILILVILFVLFGLIYSPLKKANLSSNSNTGDSSSSLGTDSISGNSIGYSSNKEIAEKIKEAQENIQNLSERAGEQAEESMHSPYYGKVRMSGISNLNDSNPSQEYLTISTNLEKTETIKVTGWFLKSQKTGNYVIMGGAALLPFPYSHTESTINLQYEDRLILVKGYSPIGISFRTNKCTGYFEEKREFYPGLPMECPLASDEDLPTFSTNKDSNENCVDAIERINRCETKGSSYIRTLEDTVNQSCKNYIKQINYNSCVAKHYSDTDFPGDEYYVYFGRFGKLWRDYDEGEKINLYDENGLIVDTLSY